MFKKILIGIILILGISSAFAQSTPITGTNLPKQKSLKLVDRFPNINKENYHVPVYTGPRASDIKPKNDRYKTRMREILKGSDIFAGHYAMAQLGCGTGCIQIRIVDVVTGKIIEPKGLEIVTDYYVEKNATTTGILTEIECSKDLSLVYVQGALGGEDNLKGSFVFHFDGKKFHLLEKTDFVEMITSDE